MQRRVAASGRAGNTNLVLILLSCLASFYVGGRLWQDAKIRIELLKIVRSSKPAKGEAVTYEETMRQIDINEQNKRIALLEMEVSAAKSAGYVSAIRNSSVSMKTTHKGRLLAVVGINTGFGEKKRRESIRNTWLSKGANLKKLEEEHGLIVRFTIGHSANRGDSLDKAVEEEMKQTNDFLILENHVEGYDELPKKTKHFFSEAVSAWDADFYVKVDDDVYVNLNKLILMLTRHKDKPRVYVGCMKSGEVFTEPNQRWNEPEWWKFGDAKYYFRHATGQVYALSRALALYISINRQILHEYMNEDVSLGSWMIGLDVVHEDERRLCCASPPDGECARRKTTGDACIAVFDWRCSGLCNSIERMGEVHAACG